MKKFDTLIQQCKLCGSKNIIKLFRTSDGIDIYICSNCKIQFMNPQYSIEYLADYYSKYTNEKSEWDQELFYSHSFCLDLIEEYLPLKGKFFDVGCGYGHLLKLAEKRGWTAVGYDIDCSTVQRISNETGIKIYCGNFSQLNMSEGKFDVVSMLHVIEHLKEPNIYLEIISKILKDDGIFFLALPNIKSRSAVLKYFLERIGLRRTKIGAYYDTGHHLWYFSPDSIKFTLKKFGFKVIDMRSGRHVKPIKYKFKKYVVENIFDKILWRSTMLVMARKVSK
jgi:2-polyprenyl-3-methyl-5-hydroxy-6-metoxy-1,4-benzoquinol methylase